MRRGWSGGAVTLTTITAASMFATTTRSPPLPGSGRERRVRRGSTRETRPFASTTSSPTAIRRS